MKRNVENQGSSDDNRVGDTPPGLPSPLLPHHSKEDSLEISER